MRASSRLARKHDKGKQSLRAKLTPRPGMSGAPTNNKSVPQNALACPLSRGDGLLADCWHAPHARHIATCLHLPHFPRMKHLRLCACRRGAHALSISSCSPTTWCRGITPEATPDYHMDRRIPFEMLVRGRRTLRVKLHHFCRMWGGRT